MLDQGPEWACGVTSDPLAAVERRADLFGEKLRPMPSSERPQNADRGGRRIRHLVSRRYA